MYNFAATILSRHHTSQTDFIGDSTGIAAQVFFFLSGTIELTLVTCVSIRSHQNLNVHRWGIKEHNKHQHTG